MFYSELSFFFLHQFNFKSVIFQLYYGVNKLLLDDDVFFVLDQQVEFHIYSAGCLKQVPR
jgi:hypothetical protein